MLSYFSQLFKIILSILIIALVGGIIFVAYNNIKAADYTSDKVIQTYIKILDNPSKDAVTTSEKSVLQEIVETSTVGSWFNEAENQIKTLRNFKQNNKILTSPIEYSGNDREYATVSLNFQNDFKNPESKIARLYLQRQGSFVNGFRWRIYQINLPTDASPIDKIKDKSQDFLNNLPKINSPFNSN